MASELPGVRDWVERINRTELPALGQTLQQVGALNGFLMSHAAELTRVILRDPSMTARVLKIANSAMFNPTRKKINTISRAVVVLGLKTLRSISLATALLDELIKEDTGPYLAQEVANAFHTAMQARAVAKLSGAPDSEEIFVSSLLHRLGAMAFWAVGSTTAHKLAKQMQDGVSPEQAERQVLGFTMNELTRSVAEQWHIKEILTPPLLRGANGQSFNCIPLAWQAVQLQNQETDEATWESYLTQLSTISGAPASSIREELSDAVTATRETLVMCGAEKLVAYVGPRNQQEEAEEDEQNNNQNSASSDMQLAILRELTQMAQGKTDVNLVLQLVLEGLHRGAGISRVVVGLVNPERSKLFGKYVLEKSPSTLLSGFQFEIANQAALKNSMAGETMWAWRDNDNGEFDGLLRKTGGADCVVGPLTVNRKVIGLFYADQEEGALSSNDVEAFELFVGQAALCLQMIGR
ncbi:HDOD domain-containing protein [Permianibacter aggregans]|uniref:HDOD domain-containing protein n=1 Tax=Permianibacter aggregans TaxID=1510150 RepID=A0A4R6V343_9GAMM|nr:HDOD domain-containing protein [Permianibacter aggregans]QGX38751.1 HDOD domain-containing protein [Permianibacter aggregans]TDQ50554.1 HDOD domain-containing protein [Permianibacter aggregans]